MIEPVLTAEDRRIWSQWERVALAHSRTTRHAGRIQRARGFIDNMLAVAPHAYAAFSGGKDSTAMLHLLAEHGARPRVMSIKDDLDFPGEEEFVRATCAGLGLELDVVHPPFSLQDWLRDHASEVYADEDLHSRQVGFAKAAFYYVVDVYRERAGSPGVFLGLRKGESYGRKMNRVKHGPVYRKATTGEWVAQPICDWEGVDVFAFLLARGAPLLDVYRCCRMAESPERIRKSWWLPGSSSRHGGMIWLKIYYPSLFRKLCGILPESAALA